MKQQIRQQNSSVVPFDDAEHEIRNSIARHHALITENAELQTELQTWQLRAQSAELEVERLNKRLAKCEDDRERYSHGLSALQAQYETGSRIWLESLQELSKLDLPRLHKVPEAESEP